MNSDRRGFFKKLLGIGALAVSGQVIPPPIQAVSPEMSRAALVAQETAKYPWVFVGYSQVVDTSEMTVSYTMPSGAIYNWVEIKNVGGTNG